MNPYFVLVLKSERWIDLSKTDIFIFSCKSSLQDREFKNESECIWSPAYNIAKEEFPFTNFKSQIILMTKKNFRSHITINYDESSSACIDLSHVVAKSK